MDKSENKTKVIIIDDDENICQLIALYLDKDGFAVDFYHDGETGLSVLRDNKHDVLLLDIMMPGIDGFETLKELRTFSDIPVIMLSARGEPMDKISGLDCGADDYITKPFEPQELIARIRAVLRRIKPKTESKRVELFNLSVNLDNFTVTLNGNSVDMPPKEIELLYTLVKTPMHVFTRDELLKQIWGQNYTGDSRTVDVHIKRVREKLGDNPHWKLTTVWGVGYKIEVF
ncbi:MAG: response regulator transcription factor [Clostridiales bacterium]|nr:response regulator transcription factor [Clostridiales bacterium]